MFEASYQGVQLQTAVAYLDVRVRRNEHSPQFTSGEYRAELLENFPLGLSILQVQATDEDEHVSCDVTYLSATTRTSARETLNM